ncbi:hypothetical protein ABE473_17100 [Stenotrophomonas sp. TWI700]|uniref:hypothetical protein n=1 Tax=Stenotrophomonas sp. TWI700 TaxID=3136792 RepID=UPI0032097DC5
MNNPYSVTARAPLPVASRGYGLLAVGLLSSGLTAIVVTATGRFVVPQFQEIFSSFGVGLPWITRVLIHGYGWIWIGPALVLLQWFCGPGGRYRWHLAAALGMLSMLGGTLLTLFGLYLPTFQLGGVV